MIRETLANNSKHVTFGATWANGLRLLSRTTSGGSTTEYRPSSYAFSPIWLKLVRSGTLFSAYTSTNGVTYTLWRTATISMASTVYIGLAVCSYNQSQLNTATFADVSLGGEIGTPPPQYNSLPSPENPVVSPGTGAALVLAWNDVLGETGYRVDRSADGVNFTRVGTTAAGVTSYTDGSIKGSMRYFYRVSSLDATGASVPSAVVSAVNRPSPPTNLTITMPNTTSLVLNWRDTDGENGYRIERSTDGTTFVSRGTVGKNVPSWTDTGLVAGSLYYYRVIPTSSLGDGPATAAASAYTRLAAVTGMAFDSIAYNRIVFHWNDLATDEGYRIERSTDGETFTTLATVATNVTTYTDTTVQQLKEYYYRVLAVKGTGLGMYPTPIFAATPAATAIPSPWLARDIGSVGGAGASGYASGVHTIIASGSDIGGTSDSFRYTYQPLVGDGQIVARVATIENTDSSAKVGLMIRESTNANARFIMVYITPGSGAGVRYRTSNGGSASTVTGLTTATAPYYVKLVRVGNVFSTYTSATGATDDWALVDSRTISMSSSSLIGLAATSRVNTKLMTSTVDKVVVANRAPTVAVAANADFDPVTSTTTVLSAFGADDHGEANLRYLWAVTAQPDGSRTPDFADNNTNASKTTTVTFFQAGVYSFTVMIVDSSGLSVSSQVTVTVSQVLAGIVVVPGEVELHRGDTLQFAVAALDQFDQPMTETGSVIWSVTSGSGTISNTGLFTASSTDSLPNTIRASVGSLASTAVVTIAAAIPAAPSVLSANLRTDGSLQLLWQDNADNEDGYRIQRAVNGGQFVTVGTTAANANTFTDNSPIPGIAVYRVAAITPDHAAEADGSIVLMTGTTGNDAFGISRTQLPAIALTLNQDSLTADPASIRRVLVYANGGDDRLTCDFAGGNPFSAGGLVFDGDGDNSSLVITGTTDADDLVANETQVTFGEAVITYRNAGLQLAAADPTVVKLADLTLTGSAVLTLLPTQAKSLRVKTLHLGAAATLDLGASDLLIDSPQAAAVVNAVKTARAAGAWTGPGITSSAARDDLSGATGLAVNSDATLVKYTWNGDANLDGIVDADDYFLIDSGFISQSGGYANGDLNFDSVVNADDYFLIDSAFIMQSGPLAMPSLSGQPVTSLLLRPDDSLFNT